MVFFDAMNKFAESKQKELLNAYARELRNQTDSQFVNQLYSKTNSSASSEVINLIEKEMRRRGL